jgi:hypothetical protein
MVYLHPRFFTVAALILGLEILFFGFIGNESLFSRRRSLHEDQYLHHLNPSRTLRRATEELVQVNDKRSMGAEIKVKLPSTYLLDQPFYIYEELIWLNATTNGESVEDMINRAYLWKHNDDLWFLNAALKHPMRTTNPEEAVLFLVPTLINLILSSSVHEDMCWGDLCGFDMLIHADTVLGESPWFQRNQGKDHVAVGSYAAASKRLSTFPNLVQCNMIALENRKWNLPDRYSVPSYYVGSPCLPRPKEYDFAMIASLQPQFTFDSRRHICQWLAEERSQYTVSLCGHGAQCPALAQARLGFHVRGDTYGANRLMDTILTGTVPIFTMKEQYDILPDWIDWDKISYFADVNHKEDFLRSLDQIIDDEALYQEKLFNLLANRDLFDWRTHVPFDTYMYQFMAQVYPQYRRPSNFDSPYSALQLSKPGGFQVFDPDTKQVWCGDSGPAKHCGECQLLDGSFVLGCDKMCRWCEFGRESVLGMPGEDDSSSVCVPLHQRCTEPDLETLLRRTVRPFRPLPDDMDWCMKEDPEDERIHGLLLAKTFKTGSTTAAAVTMQISHRLGKRKGIESCISHTSHGLSISNAITTRERASSVVWTTVRDPGKRAVSSYAFYRAGRLGEEPTDDNMLFFLEGAKNHQIAQLRTQRGASAAGGSPTAQYVPQLYTEIANILRLEVLSTYDFIAVTERMEESLIVMKLLWNLRDGDILVSSVKQAGGWTYSWDVPKTCFHVPKLKVTPAVQEYIDTDFVTGNADYVLNAFANRALDATIDTLGRELVGKEIQKHRRLKELVAEHCRDEVIFPCSDDGEWQSGYATNCYENDIGCGYPCINRFLDHYERGDIQFEPMDAIETELQ